MRGWLRQSGAFYAWLGGALGAPLLFVAAFGLARMTLDPGFDPAPRAAGRTSAPAELKASPLLTRPVPALPPEARGASLLELGPTSVYLDGVYVTHAPGSRPTDRHRGPHELRLEPLAAMLEPPRAPPDGGVEPSEIRLLLSPEAPYRAFAELIYTLGGARYATVYLLARGPNQEGLETALVWHAPRYGRRTNDAAHLEILLLPDAAALRTDREAIGPGCRPGLGVTLPALTAASAFEALRTCLERLDRGPEPEAPTVTLTAHPSTPMGLVYEVMAVLRSVLPPDEVGPDTPLQLGAPVTTTVDEWQSAPERAREARRRELAQRASMAKLQGLAGIGLGPPSMPAPRASASVAPRVPPRR